MCRFYTSALLQTFYKLSTTFGFRTVFTPILVIDSITCLQIQLEIRMAVKWKEGKNVQKEKQNQKVKSEE